MQKANAAFQEQISSLCLDELERMGFERYRKKKVDWPFNPEFHGWIGLNMALYSERVEVNPFVGIHAVEIDKLYTKLKGRKYDRGVATYAIHLGELVPEEKAFDFTPVQADQQIEAECQRLARLLASIGLDYAKTIASYQALASLLRVRVDALGGYPERFACCLYLMGEKKDAWQFSEEFFEKEPEYFEVFFEAFRTMLKEDSR